MSSNRPSADAGYDLLVPPKIVFGWGRRAEAGRLAKSLGRRAFVIWGSRTVAQLGQACQILDNLRASGVNPIQVDTISREPEVEDVDRAAAAIREHRCEAGDFVLAVGGGSALDLGKAAAAMATNADRGSVRDFLEGVGAGLSLTSPPLPIMAMPTTAGTGSEATKNAVISSYDPPFKKSLRSDLMMPRIVLIDPELTASLPPTTTAYGGMDAITQLLESYISRRARPIPRALAIQGLKVAMPALEEAVRDGASRAARQAMAHAALLSGIALANSGLGMAHGVAAALGACCRVPHGLACAVMLPTTLRVNRDARRAELAEIATQLSGQTFKTQEAGADWLIERVEQLVDRIGIPRRLGMLGVKPDQLPELVQASRGNSMDGNPRALSDAELHDVLERML